MVKNRKEISKIYSAKEEQKEEDRVIYNKEACQNLWRYFLMFCSKKTTNTVVLAQPDHTRSSQHTLQCAVSNCYSRGFTFTRATSALKTDD